MTGYQLRDKDEDIVGSVIVPDGVKDNVYENWMEYIGECADDEFPNVQEFADKYGYERLYLDIIQP